MTRGGPATLACAIERPLLGLRLLDHEMRQRRSEAISVPRGTAAELKWEEIYVSHFLARRFPEHYGMFAGNPFPVQFESGSMPANDGVWLDKDQCLSPSQPQPPQSDSKESVRSGKSGLRTAVQH